MTHNKIDQIIACDYDYYINHVSEEDKKSTKVVYLVNHGQAEDTLSRPHTDLFCNDKKFSEVLVVDTPPTPDDSNPVGHMYLVKSPDGTLIPYYKYKEYAYDNISKAPYKVTRTPVVQDSATMCVLRTHQYEYTNAQGQVVKASEYLDIPGATISESGEILNYGEYVPTRALYQHIKVSTPSVTNLTDYYNDDDLTTVVINGQAYQIPRLKKSVKYGQYIRYNLPDFLKTKIIEDNHLYEDVYWDSI